MSFERIVDIADEVLKVVEAAHAAGIVHRDLKPENVMVVDAGDRSEHVKVLDFGIALMDDRPGGERLTATNAVQGTPRYMSPEQCRGRDVGPATDVYAMGVVLYEMLTREPPFHGESIMDVMAAHMFVLPPPLAERGVKRAVPAELERITRWALSKKPEDRPTATAMRDAIALMRRGGGAAQVAARSTEERIRAMGLSRDERALGASPLTPPTDPPPPEAAELVERERPLVLLVGFDEERGDALRGTFAVNGIDARLWKQAAGPSAVPPLVEGRAPRVVVLAGAGAAEATRAARAGGSKVPVLVADVASAAETPAVVRAGASDVGLASIGDDVLCAKLKRLIERGR
jgi:serine/threonine-protein kinase